MWVGGPLPMANTKNADVTTAEKIATLIRIYRSAVSSGDTALRRATAQNLAAYGIQTGDLAIPVVAETATGNRQSKLRGGLEV
jgi:hypothetical protein